MMIEDLTVKAASREARKNDPSLPANPDEEELKAVQDVHEQVCLRSFEIAFIHKQRGL